jgi:hypothetical protein
MALLTAQDYLYTAFRKCGQMRPGYTNSADLLADGLTEWMILFDSWNAERTLNYTIPDYIYDVSTATSLNGIYGQNIQFTVGPVFTFTGDTTITSAVVLTQYTDGLIIGQYVTGTGIPALSYITAISTGVSFTLSAAATATNVGVTLTITPSFTGPRPEAILRMNLYMTSVNAAQPTRIPLSPISAEQWANISVIQLTPINVTTVFYYDPKFPQGVINVWPPLNGNALEFFTWGFLNPPAALTSRYSAPPGYQDAIIWTLAQRLWGLCTNQVMLNRFPFPYICGQAAKARDKIKYVNAPSPKMMNDFGGGNRQTSANAQCDWGLLLTGIPY